jgi:hypothetical protein
MRNVLGNLIVFATLSGSLNTRKDVLEPIDRVRLLAVRFCNREVSTPIAMVLAFVDNGLPPFSQSDRSYKCVLIFRTWAQIGHIGLELAVRTAISLKILRNASRCYVSSYGALRSDHYGACSWGRRGLKLHVVRAAGGRVGCRPPPGGRGLKL